MIPHHHVCTEQQKTKHPIGKAHYVGTSVVLTLHPSHVKRLGIDDFTFFVQKPSENGIVLEMCKLLLKGNEDGERQSE